MLISEKRNKSTSDSISVNPREEEGRNEIEGKVFISI